MYWFNTYEASIRQKSPPLLNALIHRPPRPSFSPPSPSVILAALPVRHSRRRRESRLVFSAPSPPDGWEGREGLDSRGCPENDGGGGESSPSFSPAGGNPGWCFPLKTWIPEQGSRMTEGKKCATCSPPSQSVMLTALPSVILTEGGNPGQVFAVAPALCVPMPTPFLLALGEPTQANGIPAMQDL